jgi:hypothetical protein
VRLHECPMPDARPVGLHEASRMAPGGCGRGCGCSLTIWKKCVHAL